MAYYQHDCTLGTVWEKICESIEASGLWTEHSSRKDRFRVYKSPGESGNEKLCVGIHDQSNRPFPTTHMAIHVNPMDDYTPGADGTYGTLLRDISDYDETHSYFCGYNDWTTKVYLSAYVSTTYEYEKVMLTVVVTKDYITAVWYGQKGTDPTRCGGFHYGIIDRVNPEDQKAINFIKLHYHNAGMFPASYGCGLIMNDWKATVDNPNRFIATYGVNCPSFINEPVSAGDLFGYDSGGDTENSMPLYEVVVPSRSVGGVDGIRGYVKGFKLPVKDVSNRFVSGDIIEDQNGKKYMYFRQFVSSYYYFLQYVGLNMFIELE